MPERLAKLAKEYSEDRAQATRAANTFSRELARWWWNSRPRRSPAGNASEAISTMHGRSIIKLSERDPRGKVEYAKAAAHSTSRSLNRREPTGRAQPPRFTGPHPKAGARVVVSRIKARLESGLLSIICGCGGSRSRHLPLNRDAIDTATCVPMIALPSCPCLLVWLTGRRLLPCCSSRAPHEAGPPPPGSQHGPCSWFRRRPISGRDVYHHLRAAGEGWSPWATRT